MYFVDNINYVKCIQSFQGKRDSTSHENVFDDLVQFCI